MIGNTRYVIQTRSLNDYYSDLKRSLGKFSPAPGDKELVPIAEVPMSPLSPAATSPAAARGTQAQQGAALLMRVFDQSRTEKRFDDERTLPPDGLLHRDEFPSAHFGALDRLEKSDGGINEAELAAALARLSEADQRLVVEEAEASTARLELKGRSFGKSFAGFAVGGLGLMAGLAFGGPLGLGVALLGGAGLAYGFGSALATIVGAGKEGKRLFDAVEAALGRASL